MIRCPRCKGSKMIKQGNKLTTRGREQRYQCQKCAHVFSVRPAGVSIKPSDMVEWY